MPAAGSVNQIRTLRIELRDRDPTNWTAFDLPEDCQTCPDLLDRIRDLFARHPDRLGPPAAKQMGRYVGRVIAARVAGRTAPPPFAYRHHGDLRRSAAAPPWWRSTASA